MARSLLAERFEIKVSHETKGLPVFALVLAKNGPKFAEDNAHPEIGAVSFGGPGKLSATSAPFSIFASVLSRMPELEGRLVLDKTGLRGNYTFMLKWTPENLSARGGQSADNVPSSDLSGLSLFTALQEQMGLKLESTKVPVDTIVIDHIEQPSTN
jgi:bla regulator protein blaR1